MSQSESSDSFEIFGENPVDYNPLFVTDTEFETREEAIKWAKGVAIENGFALVIANSGWKSKTVHSFRTAYLRCSRYGRPDPINDPEKRRKSSKCSCGFRIRLVEKQVEKDGQLILVWTVLVSENAGRHNHSLVVYKDGHRHFAKLDDQEKAYIRQQTEAGVLPRDIKSGLHKKTPEKPQPSSTQIYNETRKCRRESTGEMNTVQHMLSLAVTLRYVLWTENDPSRKQVTHLCMAHPESVKLFRSYYHVIRMDSTYNTNPAKNPIIEMVGVTPTGSSFLIACTMIPTESFESYKWVLNKLVALLDCADVTPSVFVTDHERGLIKVLATVFPTVDHLLCRWHVMKAINAQALTTFPKEGMRTLALTNPKFGWHGVINASTEEEFQLVWANFCERYPTFSDYIARTWGEHAGKFVLCYTNEVFHLGNTKISRVESALISNYFT